MTENRSRRVTIDARPIDFRSLCIGPLQFGRHSIRLRPPVVADAERWRALRLRDRELIEPFWISSSLDWEARHTAYNWVREVLASRAVARSGRALPMVVEVDGQFAGQCSLTAIDIESGECELGLWISADVAGRGVSTFAGSMIVDFGFEVLGLRRVIAPVERGNTRASDPLRAANFRRETTLRTLVPTGGGTGEHDVWSLNRDDAPAGGFTTLALQRGAADPVAIADHCRHDRRIGHIPLPRSIHEGLWMARYHLGWAKRLRERVAHVRLPAGATSTSDLGTGLRLRRPRLRDVAGAAAHRSTSTRVLRPIRPGSWFAAPGPAVVYDVVLDDRVIGRAELVGVNDHHRIAEVVLCVDRARADVAVTGAALRLLIDLGIRVLTLRRIASATDPDDEFAATVAAAGGLQRDGTLGAIDVWSISPDDSEAASAIS